MGDAGLVSTLGAVLALSGYAIFMIVALPLLGIAWVIYILWDRRVQAREDEARKEGSQRLQKSHSEVSDWAQQMSKRERPKRRPPPSPPGG